MMVNADLILNLAIMNNNAIPSEFKTILKMIGGILVAISFLSIASPVLAHHPSGGEIPSTFSAGFLSGLGHPVIGIDHLVFVIAIGLLAALNNRWGTIVPLVFTVATAIGTGIHLQSINLPTPELIISASVIVMGIFLVKANQTNLAILIASSAIAGIFHGYAYGESIVGAQTTALGAYLLGFCGIQLAISAAAFYLGKLILNKAIIPPSLFYRIAGFAVCGIGLAFVSSTVLN